MILKQPDPMEPTDSVLWVFIIPPEYDVPTTIGVFMANIGRIDEYLKHTGWTFIAVDREEPDRRYFAVIARTDPNASFTRSQTHQHLADVCRSAEIVELEQGCRVLLSVDGHDFAKLKLLYG